MIQTHTKKRINLFLRHIGTLRRPLLINYLFLNIQYNLRNSLDHFTLKLPEQLK